MTLIAAFMSGGRPTLIGDLLLTNIRTHRSAGTRRKVMRICERLVLAWCDSTIGAAMVCRELIREFPRGSDVGRLEVVLSAVAADLKGQHVELVGWVRRLDAWQAFHWDSCLPADLPIINFAVAGSGETIFRSCTKASGFDNPAPKVETRELSSTKALGIVGQMVASDLSDRFMQRNYFFGVAYDIWTLGEAELESIGSVTYSAMNVHVEEDGTILKLHQPFGLLNTRESSEFLLCQHDDSSIQRTSIDLIEPVIVRNADERSALKQQILERIRTQTPYSFDADWLCLVVQFYAHAARPWPLLTIVLKKGPQWSGGDENGISAPGIEQLQNAARLIANDLRLRGRMP